jgi:dephospho-CoA kinase
VLRVGLTGGIGSGKSEVSRRLAAQGALVLDADAAAREVVAPGTPGLAEVVAVFGPAILRPDGSLDRERLAGIVFADPVLLGKLNAIIHPRVAERMRALEGQAGDAAVVVHEVPLLAENGLAATFDEVVVVDAPPEAQLRRLVEERGMTPDQAAARMAAQAARERRLAVASVVIDNSGTLADLDRQVGELWARLSDRAGRGPGRGGPARGGPARGGPAR